MSPINLSSLSHIFCAIVIAANFFRCCSAFNFYKLYAIYGDCCSTFHKISKNTKGVSNVHAIGERVTTNGAALDYVAEFIKKKNKCQSIIIMRALKMKCMCLFGQNIHANTASSCRRAIKWPHIKSCSTTGRCSIDIYIDAHVILLPLHTHLIRCLECPLWLLHYSRLSASAKFFFVIEKFKQRKQQQQRFEENTVRKICSMRTQAPRMHYGKQWTN